MKDFSVIKSFARATLASSLNKNNEDEDSSSSGSGGYFSPGHENSILAPYNFSFI